MSDGRDPFGKRALFSAPPIPEPELVEEPARGRQRGPVSAEPSGRRGPIVIECSGCRAVSEVGPMAFALLQFPVGYWMPRRRFRHRMLCPACRQRVWAGVSLDVAGRGR
jgi:hypothetical protein